MISIEALAMSSIQFSSISLYCLVGEVQLISQVKSVYTAITNTIWEVTVLLMRGFRESQTHVFPGTNSNSNHDDKGHKFPANFSIVARSPLVIQWYMLTECRPCVIVLFLVILLLMILQRRIVRLPTWWQVIETGAHALYVPVRVHGCGCTYWVTLRVFSWGTLQVQLLMSSCFKDW